MKNLKEFDKNSMEYLFKKIDLNTHEQVKENNITDRVHDGGFSASGTLNFNKEKNLFTYINYYSDRIIMFDTNLNVTCYYKTIDTFQNYQVKAAPAYDKNKLVGFTLIKPPFVINTASSISKDKIYVKSTVLSDEENEQLYLNNSVIDVYNYNTGNYISSFYVPKYKGESMRKFNVINNTLIALYQHYVVSYNLP